MTEPASTDLRSRVDYTRTATDATVYGALARAEALAAGYERWMDVTRWPLPAGTLDRQRKVAVHGPWDKAARRYADGTKPEDA